MARKCCRSTVRYCGRRSKPARAITDDDLVAGTVAISGLPPFGLFMSEFLLITSTFPRAPILGVLLLLGLLIAFVQAAQQMGAAEGAEALKRLARAGLSAKGLLFNDFTPRPGHYSYGYGSYGRRQLTYTASPSVSGKLGA